MTSLASIAQALFLVSLISVVYGQSCNDDSCLKVCRKDKCPSSLDCSKTKKCVQYCVGRSCPAINCAGEECEQSCVNCTSKLVCNSVKCTQTCSGHSCEMECGANTKHCTQICEANSTCILTCDKEKSQCKNTCEGAECSGLEKEPKQVSSCDESTKNCTRHCTGNCKGKTLSCHGDMYEECHLSCENGCKMECDSKVKKCYQTCIGDTKCTSVCDASNCLLEGNLDHSVGSSSILCGLNSLVSAFLSCLMILLGTNL